MKRLKPPPSTLNYPEVQRLTHMLECEATLLSQLHHPNVVRFLGLAFEKHNVGGVTALPALVTGTYYLLPTTDYRLPTTYYLVPTTDYGLPTTYYLLPTTYYLLPSTYYLLHTTYYILPTIY